MHKVKKRLPKEVRRLQSSNCSKPFSWCHCLSSIWELYGFRSLFWILCWLLSIQWSKESNARIFYWGVGQIFWNRLINLEKSFIHSPNDRKKLSKWTNPPIYVKSPLRQLLKFVAKGNGGSEPRQTSKQHQDIPKRNKQKQESYGVLYTIIHKGKSSMPTFTQIHCEISLIGLFCMSFIRLHQFDTCHPFDR